MSTGDAVELLTELVSIDSVNPGLVPGAAGEQGMVDYLSARLERTGFTVTVVSAHGQRPSIVAVPTTPVDGPTVALYGHLDTVGVAGMSDPFTARIEGNRLYARGAGDMKGGLAALVVAAERLVAHRTPVRPVLTLVADEEDDSVGSEAVIAALPRLGVRPDVCLIGEPTDLALARSLRGFAVVRLRFEGRAAHSSQSELGINAITHLGRLLAAIDERAPAERARGGDLMATLVSGGSSAFVVPEYAECQVEMRIVPGRSGSDAFTDVCALLDPQWQAEAELVAHRDGWRMDADGAAADFGALLGGRLGTGPTFDAPYWMEAPLWQQICPTLVCGPGGGGLHAADEWVDLDQVRDYANAVMHTLGDWAQTRPRAGEGDVDDN